MTTLPSSIPKTTGNDLPDDVWRLIAAYVVSGQSDRKRACDLMSVNRTFFHFVLTLKYETVEWSTLDNWFLHLIKRLQSPVIAGHVRQLHISAWFIPYLLDRDSMMKLRKTKSWMFLKNIFPKSKPKGSREVHWTEPAKQSVKRRLRIEELPTKDIIHSVIKAVSGMINVTELRFEWRDLPLNKDTQLFLKTARAAFSTSLRKVVLRAPIMNFKDLLAMTNSINIDELDFHFDYRVSSFRTISSNQDIMFSPEGHPVAPTAEDTEKRHLCDTVVPFILRQSRLCSLTISSSSYADLAPLFDALPSLPALRRLNIEISFSKRTLSSVSGLLRLLQSRHSTIRHVSMTPSWQEDIGAASCVGRVQILQQKKKEWLPMNTGLVSHNDCLRDLECLRIPFVSVMATVPILRRSADTLKRLRLDHASLSAEDVSEVANCFAHRPFEFQHLHIQVSLFDIKLVELLATRLPGLHSLFLDCAVVAPELIDRGRSQGPENDFLMELVPIFAQVALKDWRLSIFEVHTEKQSPDLDIFSLAADTALILQRNMTSLMPRVRTLKVTSKLV